MADAQYATKVRIKAIINAAYNQNRVLTEPEVAEVKRLRKAAGLDRE